MPPANNLIPTPAPTLTVPSNPILDSYRNSNPQYVDPGHGGEGGVKFIAKEVMTFSEQYGQPLPVVGGAHYVVTGVPVPGQVQIAQEPGKTASGFTAVVNGMAVNWENLAALCSVPTDKDTVDISVSTASDSHLQVYVRAA